SWLVYERYQTRMAELIRTRQWDVIEIGLVICVIALVSLARSGMTLVAPLLFSLTILAFAMERGVLSRFLKNPLFILVGLLSYSIYMDHLFLKRKVFFSGAEFVSRLFHTPLTLVVNGTERIGTIPWQGDLFSLAYLAVLIGVSYLTFQMIEKPCREWF